MPAMILRSSHTVQLDLKQNRGHKRWKVSQCEPASFSRTCLYPSFNQKCSQVWLVIKLPVQEWEISCATTSAKDWSPAKSVGVTKVRQGFSMPPYCITEHKTSGVRKGGGGRGEKAQAPHYRERGRHAENVV